MHAFAVFFLRRKCLQLADMMRQRSRRLYGREEARAEIGMNELIFVLDSGVYIENQE